MSKSTKIKKDAGGKLHVPDVPVIPFIEGDGIGPDIWHASKMVLDRALTAAYGNLRRIDWLEIYAGEKGYRLRGEYLPAETIEAIQAHIIAIKGPLTTPVGKGIRSVNVALRQRLDLYACVRPVKYLDPVPSPMKHPQRIDMVVFRENTEDVYAGIEWAPGSEDAARVISFLKEELNASIAEDSGIGIKPMSETNTKRLVARAIAHAIENRMPSVTLMHKGNIMKYTEGAFCQWGYDIAREQFGDRTITEASVFDTYQGKAPPGRIVIKDRIADMLFQQVLLRPEEYHVIATPNLNGDYLSDALAAQAGGLGMAPGANIGDNAAVFEATHGTAPKYAGQDKVNPSSLILSGAMMLDYLEMKEASALIRKALQATLREGRVTYDLARQIKGAQAVKCSQFAERIVENLTASP